ncbi:hypothetical protein ACFQ1S_26835, partial [Kibdelosporangium lantanae]
RDRAVTRASFAAAGDVVHAVRVLDGLGPATDVSTLRPFLATGRGLRALLELPEGVEAVGRAIVAHESALWVVLTEVSGRSSLFVQVVDRIRQRSAWRAVPDILRRCGTLLPEFCAVLCARAEPQQLAKWVGDQIR